MRPDQMPIQPQPEVWKPEPDWRAIASKLAAALNTAVAEDYVTRELKQAALKEWREAEKNA